jgi:cobalt/nickel transport system permease protein
MGNKIPQFLLERPSFTPFGQGQGRLRASFIEKGIHRVAEVIKTGCIQWETASRDGFFQKIDARIKVSFLLFFILIVSLKKTILPEAFIGIFILILTVISRLDLFFFYRRVLFLGVLFGFVVAFPSALNIITPGEIILPVLHLSTPHRYWVYQIPQEIGLTREGMDGVILLTLRVMNSLALSFFVLYTTPFPEIIKALKVLKVPDSFLMVIALSYKYVFIFAKTIEEMHLAKKSRMILQGSSADGRRWVAGRIAVMFQKTRLRCEEIFKAMLSRGFSDGIKIYEVRELHARDWTMGGIFLFVGVLFLWF